MLLSLALLRSRWHRVSKSSTIPRHLPYLVERNVCGHTTVCRQVDEELEAGRAAVQRGDVPTIVELLREARQQARQPRRTKAPRKAQAAARPRDQHAGTYKVSRAACLCAPVVTLRVRLHGHACSGGVDRSRLRIHYWIPCWIPCQASAKFSVSQNYVKCPTKYPVLFKVDYYTLRAPTVI